MALNSYIPSIYPQQSSIPSAPLLSSIPSVPQMSASAQAAQNILNSSASTPSQKARAQQILSQQGGFSVVPSMGGQPSSAAPTEQPRTPGDYSQSGGWMSPEELRAQTMGLQSSGFQPPTIPQMGGTTSAPSNTQQRGVLSGLQPMPAGTGQQTAMPQIGGNIPGGTYTGGDISYTLPQGQQGQLPQGGAIQMQQSPQSGLDMYKQSAGYQLLNDPNAYQQSPGYQYALNEAMRAVQGNAASRGLLESGAALRGMTDRAVGMAQQDYGNWWNRQNQQFTDYQNRLAGLAGGNVGADMAMQLGQAQAAGTMQTGGNLGSLFGAQGAAGYGGLMNTGAAQSGNINTAGAQQAQIGAANQSTQLAGQVYNRGLF